MILIIGHSDSGKSVFAEDLLCKLAEDSPHAYIATMELQGEAGIRRVEKHRDQRRFKGFITIEKTCLLTEIKQELFDRNIQYALLECVSNLVGNEMHSKVNRGKNDAELVELICDEISELDKSLTKLVAVTNDYDYYDGCDEETNRYIELNKLVNITLMKLSEKYYTKDNNNWVCNE